MPDGTQQKERGAAKAEEGAGNYVMAQRTRGREEKARRR